MKLVPRPYQVDAVQSVYHYFQENTGNPVVALPTGCHAKGHGILMFDGTVKAVEDVVIGDIIMGPDSKPRDVLHLARGRQEMRRIIPNRGEPFVVNKDHKLLVRVTRQGRSFPFHEPRDEVITVAQYEDGTDWYRHLRKLQRSPVIFEENELPLPPYLIGIMLGDGSTVNGGFNLTTMDPEIADYFTGVMTGFGLVVRHEDKCENLAGVLHAKDPLANRSIPNRVTSIFRQLGMQEKRSWQKSIPHIYKTGSCDQRRQVLAGLIDTDGWYSKRDNYFEYCSTSEQLAKDVVFIARSLGLRGQVKARSTSCNGKSGRTAFTVCITGAIDRIPTKLLRKRASTSAEQKDGLVMGFKVEKLPEDDFYGFELSGDHLYLDEHFVIHHNTGKSVIIAMLLESIYSAYPTQRIMVLTHVKELIEQNYEKLLTLWPNAPAGIYSAGIGRKDYLNKIIFAGIASAAKQPKLFGWIDLVIIDEAHLVSPSEETMYRKFLDALLAVNPSLKVIGTTATPWRLGHGPIVEDGIFTDICFDLTSLDEFNKLIREGYLLPLIPKQTKQMLDTSGVHMRGGEFISSELQAAVDKQEVTFAAVKELVEEGAERKHWLVFATGIQHAINISEMLESFGITSVVVYSGLTKQQRETALAKFKNGEYQAAVNVGVLTTGFDFPGIDLIAVLRPTASTVLWVQMLGRGTRPLYALGFDLATTEGRIASIAASEKQNCLVLDFAGNTARLGPINDPVIPRKKGKGSGEAPVKLCGSCATYNHAGVTHCVACGAEFTFQVKLKAHASTQELIKDDSPVVEVFKVDHVTYSIHRKIDKPDAMKVTYYCGLQCFTDYVCFEHEGFAQRKARQWWRERTDIAVPLLTKDAMEIAPSIPEPTHLRVWINKKYPEILSACFDGSGFNKSIAA